MKKILLLFVSLMVTLPVMADNAMQRAYEAKQKRDLDEITAGCSLTRQQLIDEDFKGYYQGKNSLYGAFVNYNEDLPKDAVLNKKYMSKIIRNIRLCVDDGEEPCTYIKVEDNEFAKLREQTQEYLWRYNSIYVF